MELNLWSELFINVAIHFICHCVFPAEEQKRYEIFKNNMKIASHIQLYDLGTATYGASPFADLTGLRSDIGVKCTTQ